MSQIFLFSEILLYQEMKTFHFFFLLKGKRHVWMTNIKIFVKFRKVLSRFEEKKNVINIPSVKNSFKFLWALFKPFHFIKCQGNTCHSRSKRRSHGHDILLFIIIKYEIRFLSSQREKVLKLRFIYTFYKILIKQIGTYINGLFKRYISKQWVNIEATHETFTALMYNFFSKSQRICFSNWREFRN